MAKKEQRPAEYPADTHKSWNAYREVGLDLGIYAVGTRKDIRSAVSRLSVWDLVEPLLDELTKLAKKTKVEGLTFEVSEKFDRYDERRYLLVTATGYRRKTEKEMMAGELARERSREKREREARQKAERERQQLAQLVQKYPDLAAQAVTEVLEADDGGGEPWVT